MKTKRSSGLGLATAQSLISLNAHVVILDLVPPPSSSLLPFRHDSDTPIPYKFIKTDITSLSSIRSAIDQTISWSIESNAPLGGIINCAGAGTAAKIVSSAKKGEQTQVQAHRLDLWQFSLDVNLTGAFNLTRLLLEHLVKVDPENTEDGERGVVIFVSSAAAVSIVIYIVVYIYIFPILTTHFLCISSKDNQDKLHIALVKVHYDL